MRTSATGSRVLPPPSISPLASFPTLPIGLPPIDPNNPMSFISAMAALLGMFPGVLPHPGSAPSSPKARCKDYDKKGFCLMGSLCPYEHGEMHPATVLEYDPNHASLAVEPLLGSNGRRRNHQGKDRNDARGKGTSSAGPPRAAFSHTGLSHDRTNCIIAVEKIPVEHCSEDSVRNFFSQFGKIVDIEMQGYNRLAIVKFEDHATAQRAYDSPKVVSDNRFVKVYWYKPKTARQSNGVHGTMRGWGAALGQDIPEIYKEDDEMIDFEEFEKRQAEAQKAFEERQRKVEEVAAKAEEVDKQLRVKEGQIRDFKLKFAEKYRAIGEQVMKRRGREMSLDDPWLMVDLSNLQAEAEGLFADHESDMPTTLRAGSFRGSYRARGFGVSSQRGRGAYRGRGYAGAPNRGRSSVIRLDNRPKRLAIAGIEPGSKEDEAVRQHLQVRFDL